jgi:hypothetical protein
MQRGVEKRGIYLLHWVGASMLAINPTGYFNHASLAEPKSFALTFLTR